MPPSRAVSPPTSGDIALDPVLARAQARPSRGASSALVFLGLGLIVWLSRMMLPGDTARGVLEESWYWALVHALTRGWQTGVDTVFTFGPLGAFFGGVYVPEIFWTKVILWEGLFGALVAAVLTLAGAAIPGKLDRWIYFILILVLPTQPDAHAFSSMAAVLALTAGLRPPRVASAALGFVVLATFALVKFTFLATAAACMLAVTVAFWRTRSRRSAALLFLLAVALPAALWLLCGQSFASLPAYLERSVQISGGYSEAMSLPAPSGTTALCLALVVLVVALAVLSASSRPRSPALVAIAFANVVLVGVVYKAGFVRASDHSPIFFAYTAVVPFLLRVPAGLGRSPRVAARAARCACAALSLLGLSAAGPAGSDTLPGFVRDAARRTSDHARVLLRPSDHRQRSEARLDVLEAWTSLPRTREVVGTSTIDMISCRQLFLFLNGLEWRPRPVFQGYATFTPELMSANARFLAGDRAPEFILFLMETIDERLPAMDDALALQVVARDYEPVLLERRHLLLRRNPPATAPKTHVTQFEADVAFGETIPVRGLSGACHVLHLDVRYSLLGRIRTLLDQAPPLWAEIDLDTGRTARVRIVPGMCRAGTIIDPFLATSEDWTGWFTGAALPRPVALRIVSPASPWMYRSRIGARVASAEGIVPPRRPGLETTLERSLFRIPPVELASALPTRRAVVAYQEVLVVPAPSEMRFEVGAGERRLVGRFGFVPGGSARNEERGATFSAVLREAGNEDAVLFERRLDPERAEADRELQPLDVRFRAGSPGSLLLRIEADPGRDAPRDGTCWASIALE